MYSHQFWRNRWLIDVEYVEPQTQFKIIARPLTVLEHQALWEAVGWGSVQIEMTAQSIANSIYGLVAISDGHFTNVIRHLHQSIGLWILKPIKRTLNRMFFQQS